MTVSTPPVDVGIIGVGSMGKHHARVYNNLPTANFVGVHDVNREQANWIADKYGVSIMELDQLLESVDAVSIVVPTAHHYDLAVECMEAGIAILIEKPIVSELDLGQQLLTQANQSDSVVQVGHVERFNPAFVALQEFFAELSVIDITLKRLGPPPKRHIQDSAVIDLMIHDIDIVLTLLGEMPTSVQSAGVYGNKHASALLEFDSGVMALLTASRLTQRTERSLEITAENCLIELDYIDQSIDIHRSSLPEYLENAGRSLFREMSIIERPQIYGAEPLFIELESFLEVVTRNETPKVTIDDGLNALKIAQKIDRKGEIAPSPPKLNND